MRADVESCVRRSLNVFLCFACVACRCSLHVQCVFPRARFTLDEPRVRWTGIYGTSSAKQTARCVTCSEIHEIDVHKFVSNVSEMRFAEYCHRNYANAK